MSDLERVNPPRIGGSAPHDTYAKALYSIAVSLKRIADAMEEPRIEQGNPSLPELSAEQRAMLDNLARQTDLS